MSALTFPKMEKYFFAQNEKKNFLQKYKWNCKLSKTLHFIKVCFDSFSIVVRTGYKETNKEEKQTTERAEKRSIVHGALLRQI